MEAIGQYIVSVAAAAILCGILKAILPGKGAASAVLGLICGLFLAFTTIRPLAQVELGDLPVLSNAYWEDAGEVSAEGEKIATAAMEDIIKTQTEAYILDKARSFGAELTVELTLSGGSIPTPSAVRLEGNISPYAKTCLERVLEDELGISKEDQLWIGQP